jgi:hypothetical protein
MGNTTEIFESKDRPAGPQQSVATQVQKVLSEILRSTPFHASKQSQQLLQYIVDQSLAGRVESLKERFIGAEVFGRPADYDTNDDPIVRARVAEVRKRLAQFYMGEGSLSAIRIEISPGSYLATFSGVSQSQPDSVKSHLKVPEISEIEPEQHEIPIPAPPSRSLDSAPRPDTPASIKRSRTWLLLGIAVLAILLGGVAYTLRPKSAIEQFWSLMLDTPKPVLIYTGANAVYMPSNELIKRYEAAHPLSDLGAQGYEYLIPVTEDQKLGPGDLIELRNEFVTLGDVSANVDVASLLTHFKHTFDLRSGEDVAFGDLRESPTILIGAFNNQLTLQMTGDLPFVFQSGLTIRDRSNVTRQWHPVYTAPNKTAVDYALVARLPDSKTEGPLVTIAGITQSGTRAAAEFITSEQQLRELVKSAPKGWKSMNMELVLQTKVVNSIPTNPTVVAIRYW